MNDAGLPDTIRTSRLLLRPFRFADLEDVVDYASDPEWGRFLPVSVPYKREDAEVFLAQRRIEDRGAAATWAIVHAGRASGGITLVQQREQCRAMLGWSLARPLWGQGLATEAGRAVMGAAFRQLEWLHKVWANADSRNGASQRVMERLGMQREGCLRGHRQHRGEPIDDVYYGILRSEWAVLRAG